MVPLGVEKPPSCMHGLFFNFCFFVMMHDNYICKILFYFFFILLLRFYRYL